MSILFVYGTLQRHQRNHWRLFGSPFLGGASIGGELFQFPLLDFPILRRHPNHLVHGELYKVDKDVLAVQDHFEMWYKRIKVMAYPYGAGAGGTGKGQVSCWVYEGLDFLPLIGARKLRWGRWPK